MLDYRTDTDCADDYPYTLIWLHRKCRMPNAPYFRYPYDAYRWFENYLQTAESIEPEITCIGNRFTLTPIHVSKSNDYGECPF
jgi:hypothetical protein